MNVFISIVGIVAVIVGIIVPIVLQSIYDNHRLYAKYGIKVKWGGWRLLFVVGLILFILGYFW
jgi:hypothetical protein